MKKWRGTISFDVAMIILIIILFSPAGLQLSPFSSNLFAAILSVVAAAFIGYQLVKVNGRALLTARSERKVAELGAGDDNEDRVSADDVKRALGEFEKTAVVGILAKQGTEQLERAERKRATLYESIGNKFQEGSLTFQRFADVVDAATYAIVHNNAILARRIQGFDVQDYNKNARSTITGLFNRSAVPEDLRREKRQVYEASLDDMRGIIAANEKLLIELDKFSLEMTQLEANENADKNERLLEEVTTLVDQTQYYK
jgi:hypothetical protein